ncbi:hypothetical protein CHARACLAT_029883 [Characodon lateralis]|uniref:Secreted protein n=1 Tax=Characodon lateralis TaxID=208331 RepID=A0ABU7ENH7_9TELE|nr:hypothetical protein [Characodon lateralis]
MLLSLFVSYPRWFVCRLHAGCVCVLCSLCAGCDWQVLLHRCCSSESNQLGYFILQKQFTACQPQATMEKDLFSPGLAKNPTPRDPEFFHQLLPWLKSDLYPCF